MQDAAPPGVAPDAAGGRAQALTPAAIAGTLADFHHWLTALAVVRALPPGPPPSEPAPDLHALLGQVTALRHEVNLQTRSVRSQQEQAGETLLQLTKAVEGWQVERSERVELETVAAEDERLRPVLKTLLDLYDALSLAGKEIARVRDTIVPDLAEAFAPVDATSPAPNLPEPPGLSGWRRWLVGNLDLTSWRAAVEKQLAVSREREAAGRRERDEVAREGLHRVRQALDALIAGYAMSLQRLERAFAQHGLEPIATADESFDPEQMEVLEAVDGTGWVPGSVVAEVRRGYRWNGRVFRFAQVRVARS